MSNLVSIVVPVYNVEKFLDRCVLSLINQTYQHLEILLIDDGSKDSSGILCDEWARKDSRIKVVHKENQGLGMARNTGIENATGDYICFCDSDDTIESSTIQTCVEEMNKHNADIVNFGFNYINESNKITKVRKPYQYNIFEGKSVEDVFLPQLMGARVNHQLDSGFCMSSCASLYRLSVIENNNWRFVSEREIISEDFYSLLHLYKHVSKVITVPFAFYNYFYNENSLTHTFREDRLEKNAYFYQCTQEAIKKLDYNEKVSESFNHTYLGNCIAAMKQIVAVSNSFSYKYRLLKKATHDKTLLKAISICKKKVNKQKKVLFFLIENKLTFLTYILIKIKG